MPGNRASENGDFITERVLYRSNITVADSDVTESDGVPTIDTRQSPGFGTAKSFYGRNAQLNIAVLVDQAGEEDVTLELWVKASVERPSTTETSSSSESSSSNSSSSSGAVANDWAFVETVTIARSTLWIVKDIPPGVYKVVVTSMSASTVDILEQHAA